MTKEKLRAYRDMKRERDHLLDKIEEMEAVLYAPRIQKLDGMPRGGHQEGSWLDDLLERQAELLKKYKALEADLSKNILEIEEAISSLAPRERDLLRLYYIDGLAWEMVAVEMHYTWRHVHRIHGNALEALKSNK